MLVFKIIINENFSMLAMALSNCFDKGRVVVLFNGFQKKTQKTPKAEIDLAVKLMNEYFDKKK